MAIFQLNSYFGILPLDTWVNTMGCEILILHLATDEWVGTAEPTFTHFTFVLNDQTGYFLCYSKHNSEHLLQKLWSFVSKSVSFVQLLQELYAMSIRSVLTVTTDNL
jgi:hypothetical protein